VTLAFDLAYFWRVDPASVLRLPLTRLLVYGAHGERIAAEIEAKQNGG
jgi:hypothetical protein